MGAQEQVFAGFFRFSFTDAFGEVWETSKITPLYSPGCAGDACASQFTGPLVAIPNSVIPSITATTAAPDAAYGIKVTLTFSGNPGARHANIAIVDNTLIGGSNAAAVTVTKSSTSGAETLFFTNTECSSRGMCDYDTGVCNCFRGYRLADCSGQSALAF